MGTKIKSITIEYPETLAYSLKMDSKEFSEYAKFILAAKLYELGKISSGSAADLCGFARREFLEKLGPMGIAPINIDEEQADIDFQCAKNL